MTAEDRIKAIAEFGFTERQARFLVTVMLHAGVCVPRQYATFAGTAYGHNVTKFFDKLVQRGYATASGCLHNRAALYHIHHQALYRAIGQPESRYRRPVSARQAIDRVMILDGVMTNTELVWLATEEEKVAFFSFDGAVPPARAAAARHHREALVRPCASVSGRPADRCRVERPRGVSVPGDDLVRRRRRRVSSNGIATCSARCLDGPCGCSFSNRPPGACRRSRPRFVTS